MKINQADLERKLREKLNEVEKKGAVIQKVLEIVRQLNNRRKKKHERTDTKTAGTEADGCEERVSNTEDQSAQPKN